jgi:hypothetical protein
MATASDKRKIRLSPEGDLSYEDSDEIVRHSSGGISPIATGIRKQKEQEELSSLRDQADEMLEDDFKANYKIGKGKNYSQEWSKYKNTPEYKDALDKQLRGLVAEQRPDLKFADEPEVGESPTSVYDATKKFTGSERQMAYKPAEESADAMSTQLSNTFSPTDRGPLQSFIPKTKLPDDFVPKSSTQQVESADKFIGPPNTTKDFEPDDSAATVADSEQTSETPEDNAQKTIATVLGAVSNNKDKLGKSPAGAADDSGDQPKTGSAVTFKEYSGISDQLKALKREEDDPAIKQKYTDAMDRAEKLYRDREDRVAWASLAETIGTGLLKLGMAQTAKKGVDLSKIPWEKPTDWEPRLSRYGREYESSLDRTRKEYQDTIAEARQKRGEERDALKEKAEALKLKYQSEVRAEEAEKERALRLDLAEKQERAADRRAREAQDRQAKLDEKREKDRQDRIDAREEAQRRADEREKRRTARATTNSLLTNTKAEEKATNNELIATQSLVNDLLAEDDLSPKSRQKLEQKYGDKAAKAGLSLSELTDKLAKEETSWQVFGGRSRAEDKEAKQQALKQVVLEKKNMLDKIRDRKKELEAKLDATPDPDAETSAPSVPTKPAGPKLVKVKGPSGQVAEMTEENAKKYLGKQGYSLVE